MDEGARVQKGQEAELELKSRGRLPLPLASCSSVCAHKPAPWLPFSSFNIENIFTDHLLGHLFQQTFIECSIAHVSCSSQC